MLNIVGQYKPFFGPLQLATNFFGMQAWRQIPPFWITFIESFLPVGTDTKSSKTPDSVCLKVVSNGIEGQAGSRISPFERNPPTNDTGKTQGSISLYPSESRIFNE